MTKIGQYGQPGVYNAVLPTLTTGDSAGLAVDSSGRLIVSSSSGGTASIADGGTSPLASMPVGGEYLLTPPTLANGQSQTLLMDVNGNTKVTLATLIAGEDLTNNILKVNQVFSFQNITTNTTTTIKSGAGLFHGFTVNNNGFTTAGTITVYDNTAGSGTKIGTYTLPLQPPGTVLLATTFFPPQMLDVSFATGLTFVTATTAPAADITVSYR